MTKRFAFLLLAAMLLLTTGCAPLLRMSPQQDTVILLPEGTRGTPAKRFEHHEAQTMWLFRGIETVPTDYLAKIAPNQALQNVRFKQELDVARYALTFALATAAGVATTLYAPDEYKGLGLAVYLGLGLLLPQQVNTHVEGEIVTPPSDLGQGR